MKLVIETDRRLKEIDGEMKILNEEKNDLENLKKELNLCKRCGGRGNALVNPLNKNSGTAICSICKGNGRQPASGLCFRCEGSGTYLCSDPQRLEFDLFECPACHGTGLK